MTALPLRSILAPNAGPLTLTGTQTYIVGTKRVAIIDPGPISTSHINAVAALVGDGVVADILITHAHPDHIEGAALLASRVRAGVRAFTYGNLREGDTVVTDAGTLVALATPGHREDHIAFHWLQQRTVFCGDLMMGGQATALVALPEGNLAHYLSSLGRLNTLDLRYIYPTHGPRFERPRAAIDTYIAHRHERLEQVTAMLREGAEDIEAIIDGVYGTALPRALRAAAHGAVLAYLAYLVENNTAVETESGWVLA